MKILDIKLGVFEDAEFNKIKFVDITAIVKIFSCDNGFFKIRSIVPKMNVNNNCTNLILLYSLLLNLQSLLYFMYHSDLFTLVCSVPI